MLTGNTLIIRPFERIDIQEYGRRLNDILQSGEFWPTYLRTPILIEKAFEETGFSTEHQRIMLITDYENNWIGDITLMAMEETFTTKVLSYRVFEKEMRNKGYMTEAVTLFSSWYFGTYPAERITIFVPSGHTASRRVAEKSGYIYEGTLRHAQFIRGQFRDLEIFSLLKSEAKKLEEFMC